MPILNFKLLLFNNKHDFILSCFYINRTIVPEIVFFEMYYAIIKKKGKIMMKRITTGTENFKEFMDKNYYYVDKTMLIDDVLSDKVMLYTRPRRFGKTLNMSMLYYFFSNQEKENAYLFEGLNVSKHQHLMIH